MGSRVTLPQPEFDFDEWAELARRDAAQFERRRYALIDALIQEADVSYRQRLRHLQWRIDAERSRARTPLKACLRLSAMMWDSVLAPHGLRDALHTLVDVLANAGETPPGPRRPGARILPFKKPE